jgi:hypothetical protein
MKEELAWKIYNFINSWKAGKFGEISLQEALDSNTDFDITIMGSSMLRVIPFKELLDLVANVDYIVHESYPIRFKVKNNEEIVNYECGIAVCDKNVSEDLINDELEAQYLTRLENIKERSVLLAQNPDDMYYEEIEKDLREKCNITDDSIIIFEDDVSFTGERPYLLYGSNKELQLIYDPDDDEDIES